MTFTMEYTSTARDTTYTLTVTADADGALEIDLRGDDPAGSTVAEGTLALPPGGATEAARLLHQSLTAIAAFEGRRVRRSVGNANQRWTADADATLREAWLAHDPATPAVEVIRALATAHQRSPAAIRARLPRLGCDPDVTGRLLTESTASLLGRDAVAGGP
ncbi:hypothetical protein [Actinokineospora pegani]|uniref:hypothetical protein n=1 Tax=Actinokineospora pegani TaxID=2654637 RepID=UPI0012EA17E9|nr:hypothetical protein [Actinokineospora pegani]